MKDRRDILVAQGSRRTRLSQKPLTGDFAREIVIVDYLQGNRTAQIGVEGLVGYAHGTSA
jgi:hypothetical protein